MTSETPMNIRQTDRYARFMRAINWKTEKIDDTWIYIKKFPIIPAVIKIQRSEKIPDISKLKLLMQKYGARSITVEPRQNYELSTINYKLLDDPYIHTKTIYIDLKSQEQVLFDRLTSTKRRAVRRAQKLGVQVEISDNIDALISIKNRAAGLFLGFMTTSGFTKPLWNSFAPDNAKVLLAYVTNSTRLSTDKTYIAAVLLLNDADTSYYWMAGATNQGKRLFAPSLLVWEALKFSKKIGCTLFDFEGVYDERYPKRGTSWKGFSTFKNGFGGKSIYYPQPFIINR